MKKVLALFLGIIMLMGTLTGFALAETSEEIRYLRLPVTMPNATKSGFATTFFSGNSFDLRLIWESLMGYDYVDGKYVNVLADSVETAEDGLTWTVKLKKDAYWHDGEPVVAEDVAFTYAAMIVDNSPKAPLLNTLKGYQAVADRTADRLEGVVCKDEKTVVFEFDTPNFLFEELLADGCAAILPFHYFKDIPLDQVSTDAYWEKPIGTSAYKINEVAWPDYVTLTAYEKWHGGDLSIKDVLLTVYEDSNAAAMAGDIDMERVFSGLSDAETIAAANPEMSVVVVPDGYYRMIMFNQSDTGRPEMRDARVRQAINLIIDKQMIVDYIGPEASVATTVQRAEFNTDIPVWKRDIEEGKRLLEEAGFDFSVPLRLYTNYTDQQSVDIFDIITANFAEVGVSVTYTTGGDDAIALIYEIRDYDMYYGGSAGLHVNRFNCWYPGAIYDAWYYDDITDYRNERYTNLANQYKATVSVEDRKEILNLMQIYSMEDMYQIAVWFRNNTWVVNDSFKGFTPNGSDYDNCRWFDLAAWYLKD